MHRIHGLITGIFSIVTTMLHSNPKARRALFILAGALLLFFAVPLPSPLFQRQYSTRILDADGEILRVFLNQNQQWLLPPGTQPPPEKLERALLLFEDRYFYYHPGVNPVALVRALWQNISQGKIVSGASTLTMQVARLIRPKARTPGNKLLEIAQAVKIELLYSKKEILAAWLNHAPFGGNIIGYQAAALRYFGKTPGQLSWAEAATLAVLPNAPGLISPEKSPALLRRKRDRLLYRLLQTGAIDSSTYHLALLEPVPTRVLAFPVLAPHLSRMLHQRHGGGSIRTTLKRDIQQHAELLVRQYSERLRNLGIHNSAALIVETRSGRIRAWVGSQDFFDRAHHGQVDGVLAPRSSGSILKPHLYAMAMDNGLLLPQTRLFDIPSAFGTFMPSNADEKFRGLVRADDALIHSLNIPAVRLLHEYGVVPFAHFLREGGIQTLQREADDYGLSLILGGAEVRLYDLAVLYRGLGLGGRFAPLHVLAEDSTQHADGRQLISPGASWLTLNVLRKVVRPGPEQFWFRFDNARPLAWKTGTSYGHRDAWAVGVSPEWTVAVWVGNFSGSGNANLGGATGAGPLLFELFNSLPHAAGAEWFPRPERELVPVDLCPDSGYPAGPACPDPVPGSAPAWARPLPLCPFHKTLFVDKNSGEQVCSLCWKAGEYEARPFFVLPPQVLNYLRLSGSAPPAVPPHRASCPAKQGDSPLQITYPGPGSKIWLPREVTGTLQKLTLRAAHRQPGRRVFWYLDNRYLGSTAQEHIRAVVLDEGQHELVLVDESGEQARRVFYIKRSEE